MSSVWFITGNSRRIGQELAKAVLAAGHHLVATARRRTRRDEPRFGAGRRAAGRGVFRSSGRRRHQCGLWQHRVDRGRRCRRFPRADGNQFLRRGQRDARRVTDTAHAAQRPYSPDLIDRRARRFARPRRVSIGEMGRGGVLRGVVEGIRAARDQGDDRGAGRLPHGLGRFVDDHLHARPGLRCEHCALARIPRVTSASRRSRESRAGDPLHCGTGRSAAAIVLLGSDAVHIAG